MLVKGRWRKWEVIDKAIEKEGWKLLVLLRLSPLVPYNLLNITMAATKIHFWPFAIASFFGELSFKECNPTGNAAQHSWLLPVVSVSAPEDLCIARMPVTA